MPWLTDEQLQAALAARLGHPNVAALIESGPHWMPIAVDAAEDAKGDIYRPLRGRGYSTEQIDLWDDGSTFHRAIGLYWCGVHGKHHLTDGQVVLLDALDRREELETIDITNNGVIVDPEEVVDTGPITHGIMESASDQFRRSYRTPAGRGDHW